MIILFATLLTKSDSYSESIKLLEQYGLAYLEDMLSRANVYKLLAINHILIQTPGSYTKAMKYWAKAIEKFQKLKCSEGEAMWFMIKTCALQLSGLIGDTADDMSDEEYEYQDNIESYSTLMDRIKILLSDFVQTNNNKNYQEVKDEVKTYSHEYSIDTLFKNDSTSKMFVLKSVLNHQRPPVEGSTDKWDKYYNLKSNISESSTIDEWFEELRNHLNKWYKKHKKIDSIFGTLESVDQPKLNKSSSEKSMFGKWLATKTDLWYSFHTENHQIFRKEFVPGYGR